MAESVRLDPARILAFIDRPDTGVLFVSVHRAHTFSATFGRELSGALEEEVAIGTVGLVPLVMHGGPVLSLMHAGLEACGAPTAYGVLPGYWLFRQGQLLAWASGLPTTEDVGALARSALVGAVWTAVTRNPAFVAQAVRLAAEQVGGRRAAGIFRRAATEPNTRRHWRADPMGTGDDELLRAYQTLGVPPMASDAEVQQAWRARRREAHPDHAGADPAEFDRRSRICAEVNHARDVIFGHRARARRAGAA
jgi:hypothetical protein